MKTLKIIGIVFLTVIVILLLRLSLYFDVNILIYYATILAIFVPIILKIITSLFNNDSEKVTNTPLLCIKTNKIMTEEYEKLKYDLKVKYFCYDEDALNGNYNPLGNTPWHNVLANAFCIVELQNMNREYGVSNLSIIIDGEAFLNNIYIKPNESYKFILGFHYKIFDGVVPKEKDVCVFYRYMSVDSDKTFQQKSHFCFFIPEDCHPSIKILDPPISKQEILQQT